MKSFKPKGATPTCTFISKFSYSKVAILFFLLFLILSYSGKAFAARLFFIERPKLGMELSFSHDKYERTEPEIKDTTATFTEKLDISTRGFIYHPALLIYNLEFSPEWGQTTDQSINQSKRKSDAFLSGYSANATILQNKPYTLTLFGNRNMSTIRSAFAQTSRNETDSYGGTLQLKYDILPTMMIYIHTKSTQSGFFARDKNSDEVNLNMSHSKNLGTSQLSASYLKNDEVAQNVALQKSLYRTSLNNVYEFKDNAVLISNFSYLDQNGTNIINSRYGIMENLSLTHRYNLNSSYSIQYDKNDLFDKISSRTNNIQLKSAGYRLSHRLYENLFTTFNADSKETTSYAGRNSNYGYRLDFDYRRRIPWGFINISSGFDYRIVDNKVRVVGVSIPAPAESLSLNAGSPNFLNKDEIVIDSIVVRDTTGTECSGIDFICVEGINYIVHQVGKSTDIRPLGLLAGKPVVIEYDYIASPAFDYSTLNQHYGITLELWSALRLYYKLNLAKQYYRDGISSGDLSDDNIHSAGAKLKWKRTETNLEWEDKYTVNAPVKRWSISEAITSRPNEDMFLSLSAQYAKTTFKETSSQDRSLGIKSDFQWMLMRNGLLKLSAFRDNLKGSVEKRTQTGLASSFELSYRIYMLQLQYMYSHEKDDDSGITFNHQFVELKLSRTLF